MKKIVGESKDQGFVDQVIRTRLKEYLHYFVLDFIYNSPLKEFVFYGGSCLRIVYNLPRMSEDLDFEVDASWKPEELREALEKYFGGVLEIKVKPTVSQKGNTHRFFLTLPVLHEIGLSAHEGAVLRIKLEVQPVSYLQEFKSHCNFTARARYQRSFVVKHYDLPTLFAGKLLAILNRSAKGFHVGEKEEGIDFKGRDFYDLLWYMDQRILPNEKMLRVHGVQDSIGSVFDEIGVFISKRDVQKGMKQDLKPLFERQEFVDNFARTFRDTFSRLKQERYSLKRVGELLEIAVERDDIRLPRSYFVFTFSAGGTNQLPIDFVFELSDYFLRFAEGDLDVQIENTYERRIMKLQAKKGSEERVKKYIKLFRMKIEDYLQRHNYEVYFDKWESKLIRMGDENFNPEREVVFSSGRDMVSEKVKLENLT